MPGRGLEPELPGMELMPLLGGYLELDAILPLPAAIFSNCASVSTFLSLLLISFGSVWFAFVLLIRTS